MILPRATNRKSSRQSRSLAAILSVAFLLAPFGPPISRASAQNGYAPDKIPTAWKQLESRAVSYGLRTPDIKMRERRGLCALFCRHQDIVLKVKFGQGEVPVRYDIHYYEAKGVQRSHLRPRLRSSQKRARTTSEMAFRPRLRSSQKRARTTSEMAFRPRPLVLVVPMPSFPSTMDWYCASVARKGMNCAYIADPYSQSELDPEHPMEALRVLKDSITRNAQASQTALDVLLKRPEVDSQRVGVMGTSLSGFEASLLAQRDARIKKLVLLISGADIPDIIMNSRDKMVTTFLKNLIREQKLANANAVRLFLTKELQGADPISEVSRMRGLRVLMINFSEDPVIPLAASDEYARAMESAGARVTYNVVHVDGHNPLRYMWNLPEFFKSLRAFNSSVGFF